MSDEQKPAVSAGHRYFAGTEARADRGTATAMIAAEAKVVHDETAAAAPVKKRKTVRRRASTAA